jgi:hypothetical protein
VRTQSCQIDAKVRQIGVRQIGCPHIVALPFRLKRILRQKKIHENSNISPCKKNNLQKKSSERNQDPSRYYNSITNLKFQHNPKYHLSKILILEIGSLLPQGENPLSYNTL